MLLCIANLFGCKKKKMVWREVGAPKVPEVQFAPGKKSGVQYTKGTESNPVHVYVAHIYVPLGRDENGKSKYNVIMYEMETLTPENLHDALVDCGVLTEDALFVDFTTEKSNNPVDMGPGAKGKKKELEGTVRYVDLDTDLDNSDDYIDQSTGEYYNDSRIKGLIDSDDIRGAVLKTFEENYQLADCWYEPANMQDYRNAHNIQ